jgi:hypothetical protein
MTTRTTQDPAPHPTDRSATEPGPAEGRTRRPYEPPRLEVVGNVSEITMGSVGTAPESGGGFFQL